MAQLQTQFAGLTRLSRRDADLKMLCFTRLVRLGGMGEHRGKISNADVLAQEHRDFSAWNISLGLLEA
jgi:hypothetical protein